MSKTVAELRRIVDEDISSRVSQYDVLFEAITNSIQANATHVRCLLSSLTSNQVEIADDNLPIKKVDTITIIDNGDGFIDDNYNSFCKYRTDFKKNIGGKGVGRLVFLKVYKNAKFESHLINEQQVRSFLFDVDFDTDSLRKESTKVSVKQTELKLSSLTDQYFDDDRHIDRRIIFDLPAIREKILLHLIPMLFFYKERAQLLIQITDTSTGDTVDILRSDIPDFKVKTFSVSNRDGIVHKFKMNYFITNSAGNLHAFYCANNRTVCELSDKDLKITLPAHYSGFLLVESEYLNTHVNNNRNDFDIFPIKTQMYQTLSWEMINAALKTAISEVIGSIIPETQSINREKLGEIQEERPYLINYIEEEDIDMAGFLDKRHIIEKAKRRFDAAKENVLAGAGKSSYTDADLREAIELTQNELISYINDRVQVIERLKNLIDKKETVESIIHDLFMTMNTESQYYSVGVNNLWLIDDRFTTYSYAASNKRITEILESIGENFESENPNDKPDLSIFFSNNPVNPGKTKAVLIELKPFKYKSKQDRKKFQGIQQLIDYVKAFKQKEGVAEIFAFLITDVDQNLAQRLIEDNYVPLFSHEAPIYHRYLDKIGISIYVVSVTTLVQDAEARNKVFLDLIRKRSRLNKILAPDQANAANKVPKQKRNKPRQ